MENSLKLLIEVKPYQDKYLAVDSCVDRFGIGNTIKEALLDFSEDLLSYYESLVKHYPKLSTKLIKDYKFLNKLFGKSNGHLDKETL